MNLTGQPPRQKLPKPVRDLKYLKWVAELPCCVCKGQGGDAAHIRIGWYRGGQKSGDDLTVPLCRACHTEQGNGEVKFWEHHERNPFELAKDLRDAYLRRIGGFDLALNF